MNAVAVISLKNAELPPAFILWEKPLSSEHKLSSNPIKTVDVAASRPEKFSLSAKHYASSTHR